MSPCLRGGICCLAVVVCALLTFAQEPQQQQNPAPPTTAQHPVQPTNPAPPVQTEAPPPDHQITPEEAKELLGAVDGILKFDSSMSGLPIKSEVKRRLIDRDEVQAYVEKQMKEDEDAQRLKNGEMVLKKFGLVPRDFDVEGFLVKLLREQVAGYYDPKTKYVNLLSWLQPEAQMPVLAHELTHALQDQNFGMEKWVKGPNHKKHMTPAETIADDETTVARHAVLEGQAMAVMLDWMLAPAKKTIMDAPMIVDAMEAGMASGGDSPVYQSAPLYLQRMLIFPYTYGLNFERTLLKDSIEKAFAGVFQRPPQNTREVMEPKAYLADEHLAPLDPPDFAKILGKDWEMYDVGSIGEFDLAEIAEQFSNHLKSLDIFPGWRGGYYYAVKRKDKKTVLGPQDIAMVFLTRWGDAKAEASFADVYSGSVSKRYPQVMPVGPPENGTTDVAQVPTHWKTGEGDVFVETHGDLLLVMESIDEADAAKVRAATVK
ncbi:MAG: hypothetical protein ACRD3E_10030 [Terriglobales bacterium]